jgi:hypothetical protein
MASRYRVEQRHITHRGRQFHFVSYEGRPANPKRDELATGPGWFLVTAGHRWEVMPQYPEQEGDDVDRLLTEWLEAHVFAEAVLNEA